MRCLLVLCVVLAAAMAAEDARSVFQYTPYRPRIVVDDSSGRYDPGRYDPGRYDPGRYDPNKYNSGQYNPGRYDPSKYDSSGRWTPDKSGQYDGDRGDRGGSGGQYDGGYGDRGDRGQPGGFYNGQQKTYVIVPEPVRTTTTTTTPKPKVKPVDYYEYKYAIPEIEKELLSKVSLVSGARGELIGKAFFEYVNPENEVYRTDYIADSAYAL